jgi:hypothetical protein
VFGALDDIGSASLDGLLQRPWSHRIVHLPIARELRDAGFDLFPTVIDIVDKPSGKVVHLRPLPGHVEANAAFVPGVLTDE